MIHNIYCISVFFSHKRDKFEAVISFAGYLRKTSWKFGHCNNDLAFVVSKCDNAVRCFANNLLT